MTESVSGCDASNEPRLTDTSGKVMSDGCMICGRNNAGGLRMRFENTEDGVRSTVTVPENFQGFDGIAHGGTVAAILDDAMWWAVYRTRGAATMTAEMKVRYHGPVQVGEALVVEATLTSYRGRLHRARAALALEGGGLASPLAEAEGAYLSLLEG